MTTTGETMRISTEADLEQVWSDLADPCPVLDDEGVYRLVDPDHPLDIYAGIRRGSQVTLLLISPAPPPEFRKLRSVAIEAGKRSDGRFALLLALQEPVLRPVFARLCADLVNATRTGVDPARGPAAVLTRLDRWWRLLEGQQTGLGRSILMGLIGELLVLRDRLVPDLGADLAVKAWIGPDGADQDFHLPTGLRIEVKAAWADQDTVNINGLDQLDGQGDPIELVIVRLAETGRSAPDALTAPMLVASLRETLALHPAASSEFESLLAALGWHEHPSHHDVVVRFLGAERHVVDDTFPRLVRDNVPDGVTGARYFVLLPAAVAGPLGAGLAAGAGG